MIRVEAYKDFDQEQWRTLVTDLGGNVFHLPEVWITGQDPDDIRYLLFKIGDDIAGMCVGICQKKSFLRLFKSSNTLYLPTVPVISKKSGVKEAEIYEHLIAFAARDEFRTLNIGVRWGADFSKDPDLSKFIDQRLIEFTVDLGPGMDDIMKSFHKKHRKNIKKAQENDVVIIADNSLDCFMELKGLQESSSLRASTKGNIYQVQDENYYIESHRNVYQKGLGTVMVGKKDGKSIAGLAYLFFGDKAVTVRSGATPEAYALSAPYYLQYELIRRMKDEGYSILNIGGMPVDAAEPSHPQHGLYQFKKGFGGVPNLRTGLTIELH